MNAPKRQCINCRHFTRDFNRFFDRDWLEQNEAGHCMAETPRGKDTQTLDNEGLQDDSQIFSLLYVPPVVYEDAVCSKFETKQGDDK